MGTALIQEWCLFQTLRGILGELSETRAWYAQFYTNSIKYIHLDLLNEPGFKSFPTSKI